MSGDARIPEAPITAKVVEAMFLGPRGLFADDRSPYREPTHVAAAALAASAEGYRRDNAVASLERQHLVAIADVTDAAGRLAAALPSLLRAWRGLKEGFPDQPEFSVEFDRLGLLWVAAQKYREAEESKQKNDAGESKYWTDVYAEKQPSSRWHCYVAALADDVNTAMRSTNAALERLGVTNGGPLVRLLVMLLKMVKGETPSHDAVARYLTRQRPTG